MAAASHRVYHSFERLPQSGEWIAGLLACSKAKHHIRLPERVRVALLGYRCQGLWHSALDVEVYRTLIFFPALIMMSVRKREPGQSLLREG